MHPTDLTLSDYVDGALDRAGRADVARHLEACAACRQLVDDLREIGRAASALEPIAPPARVWNRIEKQIHGESQAARIRPSSWTWLAAAAVLVVAVFIGIRFAPFGSNVADEDSAMLDAAAIEAELQLAEEHYQKAIAGLERIAESERAALDPDTAATLQKNLTVINEAIGESRAAVRAEPQSEQAQFSLIENFKMKLALLQDTVALINELRAGNDVAAARIISGS